MPQPSYLETLKTKPDAHKKQVALLASLTITILIVLIWLVSFRFLGTGRSNNNLSSKAMTPLEEVKTAIKNSTGEVVNSISEAKANVQGIFNTAVSAGLDSSSSATSVAPVQRQL